MSVLTDIFEIRASRVSLTSLDPGMALRTASSLAAMAENESERAVIDFLRRVLDERGATAKQLVDVLGHTYRPWEDESVQRDWRGIAYRIVDKAVRDLLSWRAEDWSGDTTIVTTGGEGTGIDVHLERDEVGVDTIVVENGREAVRMTLSGSYPELWELLVTAARDVGYVEVELE